MINSYFVSGADQVCLEWVLG